MHGLSNNIMLLNNEPHPNHTPTSNSNLEPPNPKTLSNQPHTADEALVILATKTLSKTKNVLHKGLTFISNQKNLTIQNLHRRKQFHETSSKNHQTLKG